MCALRTMTVHIPASPLFKSINLPLISTQVSEKLLVLCQFFDNTFSSTQYLFLSCLTDKTPKLSDSPPKILMPEYKYITLQFSLLSLIYVVILE